MTDKIRPEGSDRYTELSAAVQNVTLKINDK